MADLTETLSLLNPPEEEPTELEKISTSVTEAGVNASRTLEKKKDVSLDRPDFEAIQADVYKRTIPAIDKDYFSRSVELSTITPNAPTPVGDIPSFLSGATAGYLGQEPNTLRGEISSAVGLVAAIAATSVLTRGIGVPSLLAPGEAATYQALFRAGGMATVEGATPEIVAMSRLAQMAAQGIEGGIMGQVYNTAEKGEPLSIEELTGWVALNSIPLHELWGGGLKRFSSILRKTDSTIDDLTEAGTARTTEDAMSQYSGFLKEKEIGVLDETKAAMEPPDLIHKTQLEADMTKIADLGDQYKARKIEAAREMDIEEGEFRWGKGVDADELIREGQLAKEKRVEDFLLNDLKGGVSKEELGVIDERLQMMKHDELLSRERFYEKVDDLVAKGELNIVESGGRKAPDIDKATADRLFEIEDTLQNTGHSYDESTLINIPPFTIVRTPVGKPKYRRAPTYQFHVKTASKDYGKLTYNKTVAIISSETTPVQGTIRSAVENIVPVKSRPDVDLKARRLTSDLDNMERAVYSGLKPDATPETISKKLGDLKKNRAELREKYAKDPTLRGVLDSAIETVDDIVKHRPQGISKEYVNTANFERAQKALDTFSTDRDFSVRTGEVEGLMQEVEKNFKKFDQRLRESLRKATSKDTMALSQAEELYNTIASGKKIEPQRYSQMRTAFAKFSLRELEKSIPDEWINPDIAKRIQDVRAKEGQIGNTILDKASEVKLRQDIEAETADLRRQLATSYFSNPNMARALAQKAGNSELERVQDMFFASLGDTTASAAERFRATQGRWQLGLDITANRVASRPAQIEADVSIGHAPAKDSFVAPPPRGGSGDAIHLADTPEEISDLVMSMRDLNPGWKLFGSLRQHAYKAAEKATNPKEKSLMTMVGDWFDVMDRRYQRVTLGIKEFGERLTNYDNYLKSLGKSESVARKFPRELDTLASRLIDDELEKGVSRAQAYENVQPILDQKIMAQGAEVREGYKRYKELNDWAYDQGNRAVDTINARIDRGEIKGEKLDYIPYRPAHNPIFYFGDLELIHVHPDGHRATFGFAFTQKDVAKHVQKYIEDHGAESFTGQVIAVPKLFDDFSHIIAAGNSGLDLDKAFGVGADQIKKLIGAGQWNENIVYDVFFGNRKMRSLNLDEFAVETNQALMMQSIAATRYRFYGDMTIEGRQLAEVLHKANLPTWADAVSTRSNTVLGMATGLEKTIDKHLKSAVRFLTEEFPPSAKAFQSLGITPNSRIVRATSNFLMLWGRAAGLGWNIGASLGNLSQIFVNFIPAFGAKTVTRAMGTLKKSMKDPEFATILRENNINLYKPISNFTEQHLIPDVLETKLQRTVDRIDNIFMFPFNPTETYQRSIGALSAFYKAKEVGKKIAQGIDDGSRHTRELKTSARIAGKGVNSPEARSIYVNRMLKDYSFHFNPAEMPELLSNPILKVPFQFTGFFIKQFELMSGVTGTLSPKERLLMMGLVTSIGGIYALPGVEDLDRMARWTFGISPKLLLEAYAPEILAGGLPTAAGINLSNYVNQGGIATFTSVLDRPAGVGMSSIYRAIAARRSGGEMLPVLASQSKVTDTVYDAYNMLAHGYVTDTKGKVSMRTEDMSPVEKVARFFGVKLASEHSQDILHMAAESMDMDIRRDRTEAVRDIIEMEESDNPDAESIGKLKSRYKITSKQIRDFKKNAAMNKLERTRQQSSKTTRDIDSFKRVYEKLEE